MSVTSFTRDNPATTALIGLVAIVMVIALALDLNNLPLIGAGPLYRGDFTDTAGLQSGEEVRIAGIKVGEVTDIALAGDKVVVSFRVNNQRLGYDTRAAIKIKTLLGQHFLDVDPQGSGQMPAGSEIPLDRTSTPVQIAPTIQDLTSRIDAIDTRQLGDAFTTLSAALGATAPDIRRTLDGLTSLSRVIATRDDQIQRLFAHARDVSTVIASRDGQIVQLIDASNQVLEVLEQRREDIHNVLVGTGELAHQLSGVVGDNRQRLHPALRRLDQVLTVLRRNDDNLNTILTQLPVYLRLLTTILGSGPWGEAEAELPRHFAVCDAGPTGAMARLLNPILAQTNRAHNGSSSPCLPLGPAAHSSTPTTSGGGR